MLLCFTLGACSVPRSPYPGTIAEKRAALDRIADRCKAPRTSWTLLDETHVTLELASGGRFETADCLITEFNKANLPLQLGFIGNEYYPENRQ